MDLLRQFTVKHTCNEVWADFVELAAIAIHESIYFNSACMPTGNGFENQLLPIDDSFIGIEEQCRFIVSKHCKNDMGIMARQN